jgi:nucleoside-triphosphatase THEP1
MTERRGGRITDFFQTKRPLVIDIPSDTVVETANEEESFRENPGESTHPFFLAQAKRRREAEFVKEHVGSLIVRRRFKSGAPLFPNIAHVGYEEFMASLESPESPHKWSPRILQKLDVPTTSIRFEFDQHHQSLTRKSLTATSTSSNCYEHDPEAFSRLFQEILAWTTDTDNECSSREAEDVFTRCWSSFDFRLEKCDQIRKRPIIFISGPTGSGKSYIAPMLAEHLAVPFREINNVVTIRNGKPFEDILSASHGQRHVLKQFIQGSNNPTIASIGGQKIRMVVLIDEVDLVYQCDRFYSPLNAFLKDVPESILTIITCNSQVPVIQKFVELPTGTLTTLISSKEARSTPSIRKDLIEAQHHSDLAMLTIPRYQHVYYQEILDIPVCCTRDDMVELESLAESELIFNGDSWRDEHPMIDPLLIDLHKTHWMSNCRRHLDWVLDYRPYWRAMENEVAERHEMRVKRTVRQVRPRTYLSAIPFKFVERLRMYK